MHELLTHVLLYTARYLGRSAGSSETSLKGCGLINSREVADLMRLATDHVRAVEEILRPGSPTLKQLRRQGLKWAWHVLEGACSWLAAFAYILGTMMAGSTPLRLFCDAVLPEAEETLTARVWRSDMIGMFDACIYMFAPFWCCMLLRVVQRRSLLHRVAGRQLVVADVPWVSQAVEAFVSKLFALSYSMTSLNVASSNPVDHFVR